MSSFSKKARAGSSDPLEFLNKDYTSKPVNIPVSFLTTKSLNDEPVTYTRVDFAKTALPEYHGFYAVVLENVLSPAECAQLIQLVQQSAGAGEAGVENDGWQPALVNGGLGREYLLADYRNSDRIIWDERTVVQRLWERCLLAPGLKDDLSTIETQPQMLGRGAANYGPQWKFTRLNERMRFLRYGKGQFFKEHCDAAYVTPDDQERTFYTLHLYLNDSVNEMPNPPREGQDIVSGGATTFHSHGGGRRLDIDPKAGRVLIFQHAGLLHSGDTVTDGVKYTMRTDLLFKLDKSTGTLKK